MDKLQDKEYRKIRMVLLIVANGNMIKSMG